MLIQTHMVTKEGLHIDTLFFSLVRLIALSRQEVKKTKKKLEKMFAQGITSVSLSRSLFYQSLIVYPNEDNPAHRLFP